MIIALISIGIMAVFLLLGLLKNVLSSLGLNTLSAIVILAILVGSAFIPYINILGVRFGVAGFLLPLVAMVLLDLKIGFTRELFFTKVSATLIVALVFPIIYFTFGYNYTQTALVTIGVSVVVAVISFMITRTYAGAISSVVGGIMVGDVIAQIVGYFALGSTIAIGSSTVFGLIMLSVLMCGLGIQVFSSVREKFISSGVRRRQMSSEEAEDSEIDGKYFDEYFSSDNEEK